MDTEWLITKCSIANTQAIESFNAASKTKLSPKYLHFQKSFKTRNHLAIIKWNHPYDWYELVEEALKLKELSIRCKQILRSNSLSKSKEHKKVQMKKLMIKRNQKRKIKNKSIRSSICFRY